MGPLGTQDEWWKPAHNILLLDVKGYGRPLGYGMAFVVDS